MGHPVVGIVDILAKGINVPNDFLEGLPEHFGGAAAAPVGALQLRDAAEGDVQAALERAHLRMDELGCRYPVNFEFPPLPGKPSSVCLATKFA